MKFIKKIIYAILLLNLAYYGYLLYTKGYKYNADDPDTSLTIMVKMTAPFERATFLKKFEIACEGVRCINLHGLTKEEIYNIANKKISKYTNQ